MAEKWQKHFESIRNVDDNVGVLAKFHLNSYLAFQIDANVNKMQKQHERIENPRARLELQLSALQKNRIHWFGKSLLAASW